MTNLAAHQTGVAMTAGCEPEMIGSLFQMVQTMPSQQQGVLPLADRVDGQDSGRQLKELGQTSVSA